MAELGPGFLTSYYVELLHFSFTNGDRLSEISFSHNTLSLNNTREQIAFTTAALTFAMYLCQLSRHTLPRMCSSIGGLRRTRIPRHLVSFGTTAVRVKRGLASLPHDLGGDLASFGPIDPHNAPDDVQAWEQQCHSLFVVLATKKFVTTDALRATIEALTPQQYGSWTYYEKWSAAMASLLLDKGIVTHDELSAAMFGHDASSSFDASPETAASAAPRFETGDTVRVKPFSTGIEWQRPHLRTPGYVYGAVGVVERYTGMFQDPSFLAFGWKAPSQHLYRVKFRLCDIWPEQQADSQDFVEVELYQHWLEPSDVAQGHAYTDHDLFDHHSHGEDCIHEDENDSHHHHHHRHHHNSADGGHGHDHVHEARPLVEQRAVDREGPARPGKQVHQALMKILTEKGLATANEVRIVSEKLDTAGKNLDGARLVVEAWTDPVFQDKLLTNARKC